jgi:hypothetical protein
MLETRTDTPDWDGGITNEAILGAKRKKEQQVGWHKRYFDEEAKKENKSKKSAIVKEKSKRKP